MMEGKGTDVCLAHKITSEAMAYIKNTITLYDLLPRYINIVS